MSVQENVSEKTKQFWASLDLASEPNVITKCFDSYVPQDLKDSLTENELRQIKCLFYSGSLIMLTIEQQIAVKWPNQGAQIRAKIMQECVGQTQTLMEETAKVMKDKGVDIRSKKE